MSTDLSIIIFLLGFGCIIFFLNRKLSQLQNKKNDDSLLEWLKAMQATLESTNKTVHESLRVSTTDMVRTLQENSRQLNDRLDKAALVIREVGTEVGKMTEIGRNMKELQDFLKSPKLRGNIGEHVLKDLIAQMFPKHSFFLQYQFKSGEKVDAAIKTDGGILSIDAKFPMENFQKMIKAKEASAQEEAKKEFGKDVKKHIDAISKKYILPDEGTMDFALMYVPSESVYYEIVNMEEIMDYARKSRVYFVSPSTLYAHLQTILLSFEGKRIEQHSKEVFQLLRSLQIDYEKVQENVSVLGRHITNASSQYANVHAGFTQFGQKLNATKRLEDKVLKEIGAS